MLKLIFLIIFVGYAAADTAVINGLADQLLASASEVLRQQGRNILTTPAFSDSWHSKILGLLKFKCTLKCSSGTVRDLATIHRTGDVTLTTEGNKAILRFQVGLGQLEVNIHKCKFKVHHLASVSSHVEASVSSNSIDAQISVSGIGSACVASVDSISLNQLGKIHIRTGGGLFHKAVDSILNHIVNHMHKNAVREINNELRKAAAKAIGRVYLCRNIPH